MDITHQSLTSSPTGSGLFTFKLGCTKGIVRKDNKCGGDDLTTYKARILNNADLKNLYQIDNSEKIKDNITSCLSIVTNKGQLGDETIQQAEVVQRDLRPDLPNGGIVLDRLRAGATVLTDRDDHILVVGSTEEQNVSSLRSN